ncbi:MAG: hypothetical protein CL676_04010 [Bdellovibrionaceae bacterium]|nr:hypothetical protein [Pseudobdellovibrionaceae bacterium]|tara:strand:+ start:589 stop:774 length:186 start_codon:yes stop_codon:yes gene_type:complete
MKIIKEKDDNPSIPITFRLPQNLIDKLTSVAEKNDLSRQKLVTAILEQALNDKSFKLRVKG